MILGIVGWSGAGKTTLIEAMIPQFVAAGRSVATIKHAHHGFDMDRPGKDSFRHRAAGAREVLVASDDRWVLLHETGGTPPRLADLLRRLDPADIVLVEGFRGDPHPVPMLEVFRPALGKPPLWPDHAEIVAVASDEAVETGARPLLSLNAISAVVAWALQRWKNEAQSRPAA